MPSKEGNVGAFDLGEDAIKSSLRGFLSKALLPSVKLENVTDSDSFLERGILDSTGVLELVGYLESQFSIRVESDEITPDNLDSLNKLANFVMSKKAMPA